MSKTQYKCHAIVAMASPPPTEPEPSSIDWFVVVLGLALFGFIYTVFNEFKKTDEDSSSDLPLSEKTSVTPEMHYDETVRLLREIKRSNDKIHFWTRVVGAPVLVSLFFGIIALFVKACS